jgi:hypothetical protein
VVRAAARATPRDAMKPIGFVDFSERVLRVRLTPAQRVLALVAFDSIEPGELEGEARQLALRLFGGIDTIPQSARSVLAIVKGSRVGGSYIFAAIYSLWRALTADLSGLAPGEQASALIVAPDMRLARQCLRYALGAAKSVSAIAVLIESEAADGFVLRRSDGAAVAIEVLPATRGGSAVRGRSLVSMVMTEPSFMRDENAAINDLDLFRAGAPRVLRGGLVVLESTPWAEAGLLYDLFSKNFGEPSTALAAHAPTLLMRPDETAAVVARERERDPDNAAREFDAEFILGGSGLFFGPELLSPAMVPGLDVFSEGGQTFVGGDIGLVTDASAFVAVRRTRDLLIVQDILEMRPRKGSPLKLSEVIARASDFARKNGTQQIIVDHYELAAGREHLRGDITLKAAPGGQEAKVARFIQLRENFRQGRIRIPQQHVRLATQLAIVASKPTSGGGTQIILPRRAGTHMDVASAGVLAFGAATKRYGRMATALMNLTAGDCLRLEEQAAAQQQRLGRRF